VKRKENIFHNFYNCHQGEKKWFFFQLSQFYNFYNNHQCENRRKNIFYNCHNFTIFTIVTRVKRKEKYIFYNCHNFTIVTRVKRKEKSFYNCHIFYNCNQGGKKKNIFTISAGTRVTRDVMILKTFSPKNLEKTLAGFA
jgi:hypothetical protein